MSGRAAAPRPRRLPGADGPRLARRPIVVAAASAVALGSLGRASGGYFPEQWGLLVLGFALAGLVALIVSRRLLASPGELLMAGGLAAFAVWQALSALWTTGDGPAVLAGERALVYAAAAIALALSLRRGDEHALVVGVAGATTFVSLDGLATHLFPEVARDPLTYRFVGPIGYSNASGLLAAIGLLLVLGLALTGSRRQRLVAAFWAVPLAATLYLTLSRGSMLALVVGLAVLVAASPARLRLVGGIAALGVPVAAAVAVVARIPSLTGPASLAEMQSDGRRAAAVLGVLAVVTVAVAAAIVALEPRLRVAPWFGRALAAGALAALALAIAAVVVREGGPVELGRRAVDSFRSLPERGDEDLERRLLSASSSVRSAYWGVAAGMVGSSPVVGEGAGSFERRWAAERPLEHDVRNAHNLYLETLAETGAIGLLLLAVALVPPLVAVPRARARSPVGPVAAGAYTLFLAHAALDWDWQIPLVTLAGLACGVAVLLPGRSEGRDALGGRARAGTALVLTAAVAAAFVAHTGNNAVVDSELALERGDAAQALADARRARRWMPWSSLPYELEGEAAIALERLDAAAAALRRATELDPESWRAWYDLALVTEGAARRESLARALRLNPLNAGLRDLQAGASG